MFVNNGNGTFTEAAAQYNLDDNNQSWTADFQDIDNDGDMDCFITNHMGAPSRILENNGSGIFNDITPASGISGMGNPYQGLMVDFDNDGYVDILSSGDVQKVYRNNGNKTFTEVTGSFNNNLMRSFAIGDLNNDGFQDVYASYWFFQMPPNVMYDKVWINNGNANRHVKFRLRGVLSNINAIGARIDVHYGNGLRQTREIRAGESYGITNTFTAHFGMGNHTSIDSAVVRWPSGHIQRLASLATDSTYFVLEDIQLAPLAAADHHNLDEDTTGLTANVGINDSDFNANIATNGFAIITHPLHAASFALAANGEFSYTPTQDFNGMDSLQYAVCDLTSLCDSAWVFLTINPMPDRPMAIADWVTLAEDSHFIGQGVATNDIDVDGDINTQSYVLINPPTQVSSFNLVTDGVFSYRPTQNFNGLDSFHYSVCDWTGLCDSAWVYLTIAPVNDRPMAAPDTLRIAFSQTVSLSPVTTNDTDPHDASYGGVINPQSLMPISVQHGTINLAQMTYTGPSNTQLIDYLEYEICDNDLTTALCDTGLVTILITPPAISPNQTAVTLRYGQAKTIPLGDVYDGELPGAIAAITAIGNTPVNLTSTPSLGSLALSPFSLGRDTLVYSLTDLFGWRDTFSVHVEVLPKNDTIWADVFPGTNRICIGRALMEMPSLGQWVVLSENLPQTILSPLIAADSCLTLDGSNVPNPNGILILANCSAGYCDTTVVWVNNIGFTAVVQAGTATSDKLMVFNAISPNGDGLNDYLHLNGINGNHHVWVEIFSQNGDRVFNTENYRNQSEGGLIGQFFDGTHDGGILLGGTYFIVVHPSRVDKGFKGYIEISH